MHKGSSNNNSIKRAADIIRSSSHAIAFTGAGISVESGIPPFRGKEGIWSRFDPLYLDYKFFKDNPEKSWKVIMDIFYECFDRAAPNKAHRVLARMEKEGLLNAVVTQNIDNLHRDAGSKTVFEFHGTTGSMSCLECYEEIKTPDVDLSEIPPRCKECGGILKPDFTFFGEPIPLDAGAGAFEHAERSDTVIVIGTTGEVMPAAMIPRIARRRGASVIEVNTEPSMFTVYDTDVFLQGKATEMMAELEKELFE